MDSRYTYLRRKSTAKLVGLWVCGVCLASSALALQIRASGNPTLRKWQDVSFELFLFCDKDMVADTADSIQFLLAYIDRSDRSVPLACFIVTSAGYTFFALSSHWNNEQAMALVAFVCIVLVLIESCWNNLRLNLLERFFVALPLAIAGGLSVAELLTSFKWDNAERSQVK